VGRDIEDAIMIGLIARDEVPSDLGRTNRDIVNTLAMNIIENSRQKDEIAYSKDCFDSLCRLKDFNYDKIYRNDLIKKEKDKIKEMMAQLYQRLLGYVREGNRNSPIFLDHIDYIDKNDPDKSYLTKTEPEVIVVDYIAGMTDDYFIHVFNELFFPRKLPFNFRQIERLTGLSKENITKIMSVA